MSKIITAAEAAMLFKDEMTVVYGTMGLAGWAEEVAQAVEKRFLETGHPKNLNIVQGCFAGDRNKRGIVRWGHEGLIKRWMGSVVGFSAGFSKLIEDNKIEAYCIPQGVIVNLWREIAAGRPGMITKVGLGTFVDPRVEGGKMNRVTTEERFKVIEFEGEEYLFFKSFPVNLAMIRGTTIDENGNLTLDKDGMFLEQLQVAQAAKNSGGIVIAQAEYLAKAGSLHPKAVKVPGILVDYIVIATDKEASWQTEIQYFEPSFSGDTRVPLTSIPVMPLTAEKVIVRRAAMELIPNAVVNLGIGIAADVATIANEEGVSDMITLTTEAGVIGGVPAGGQDFGQAYNPEAMLEHTAMFDFYDGGGLDIAFLGLAESDADGNVNVSKFGRPMGSGGFINITQNSKKIIFTGTFTSGGLDIQINNGQVKILQEGKRKKFKTRVEQITFSGKYAREAKKHVFYVTERCVFALLPEGLTLIEIAPGIDLEKDVLAFMDFKPHISKDLKLMPAAIFEETWGGLKGIMQA